MREVDRDRDKDENKVRNRERDRDTPRDTRNTMGIFIECSILIGATAFGLSMCIIISIYIISIVYIYILSCVCHSSVLVIFRKCHEYINSS